MLGLVGLIILLVILVNLTPVQNYLARKAASILADKLKTKVSVGHVRIDFLNHVKLQELYIEDHAKDTLLYAGTAEVRITDWFFLKKEKPVLSYIALKDAYAHLYRTASSAGWNYQFVIDAFDNGKKKTTKKQNDFEIDLKKMELANVRFHMDDAWTGNDLDIDAGDFLLEGKDIDLKKKIIDLDGILLNNSSVYIGSYRGGKPKKPKSKTPAAIDTTAFNTDNWVVKAGRLSLKNCAFTLKSDDDTPMPAEFDPAHIGITGIDIKAEHIFINKDTLTAQLAHLAAKERSGIEIKECRADVSVSPIASVCNNLYLETNHSKLTHYYAMRYDRFPDFEDYIHKVRMEGHLQNAVVDARDIAFFAPQLRQLYPATLRCTGDVAGTVDRLRATKMEITDGVSTIKGNLAFTGLPDIYSTYIDYSQGEILTGGNEILKYAPDLKGNPNLALERVAYAYFNGNFTGFINDFVANGILKTNLGTLNSNVYWEIPPGKEKTARYSGKVSGTDLNLGALLRQPMLGSSSFFADVKGVAINPENANVQLNANIAYIGYNGYNYKNIIAEGVLAKKKFDGKLLVDDPNLALAFNGSIDASTPQPTIIATANLLKSDFRALNFTRDSILATADFDLNCTGSNIDNFLGAARLYNINITRNSHRVDLDSITLVSSQENGDKRLVIESNLVSARIQGRYQLSSLPYSAQYYLAGYLPNYIPAPKKAAPDQALTFDVVTRDVDSLLAVLAPGFYGFDNATLKGSLNTAEQQLRLNVNVPYGSLYGVRMNDVVLNGEGSYRQLALTTNVGNLQAGDSLINISLNADTRLGNDSLWFKIATTSALNYGTAVLNGQAYAHGDSLYLGMQQSEFYLNQNKWEIPAGSRIVFSKNYLSVNNLYIQSGLQQVAVSTLREGGKEHIAVDIKELDLAQLGALGGLAGYQPEGRLNGTIVVADPLGKLKATATLRGSDVKLGTDTLGEISLAGSYDAAQNRIIIGNGTGIYRGEASAYVSGTVILDSNSRQRINGTITFNHAELAWVTPFISEFVSNVNGTANGRVQISGTAASPEIAGNVDIDRAAMHINYLGTNYTIPTGTIQFTDNSINLGTLTVNDAAGRDAQLSGTIQHDHLKDFNLRLRMKSESFEVVNLRDYENSTFYGNLVANVQSMSVNGPLNDIRINIKATPAGPSHLYLPVGTGGDVGTYSYVTFKNYGTEQPLVLRKNRNKLTLNIDAYATPDLEITMILDPATGDAINAKGTGFIKMEVPVGNDFKMYGSYDVDQGDYTFTFRQLFFKRTFIINQGSKITFNGPIANTRLDVHATYRTLARLYDLLSEQEKQGQVIMSNAELTDAKQAQNVDVLLHMKGSLERPDLSFNLDLPEKRSIGTYAYTKLQRINQNDRELFDQVASLLLVGYFFPPEGLAGSTAATGALTNISDIISSTASSQLTNIVNKLLGDKNLAIELKYKNYNLSDPTIIGDVNRNELRVGLRQNLFNDRLIVELGSYYDWGRPTTTGSQSNAANLNLAGDFRAQYLITQDGRLRANLFRTTTYDVLVNTNIARTGAGISWRKSFDNLTEFFRRPKVQRIVQQKEEEKGKEQNLKVDSTTIRKTENTSGTW